MIYFIIMKIIIILIIKSSLLIKSCQEGKNNCLKCNPITELCYKCATDLYIPNDYGGCSLSYQCKPYYNHCVKCQENGKENICQICENGYFPDSFGGCSYTKNCLISKNGNCIICNDNYILIGKELKFCKSIYSPDLKNCKNINITNGLCSNCTDGFFLNSLDRKCCKTENCSESIYNVCKRCNKGYYFDKKEEKCKIQNNNFINCKESITGEKCDICDDNYYFDYEGKCINMNYCTLGDKKNTNICKKCNDGYYLTVFKDVCTNDINCYEGDKNLGICLQCKEGFYLDFKDGKCKANIEDNEFKHCKIADNNICKNCIYRYTLSEDLKCSIAKNCEEVKNGKCIQCLDNYYLGLDNKCINIENCIYSMISKNVLNVKTIIIIIEKSGNVR